ncbi:MAG TPA: serine hydrolase domain-containing protein [Pyrinomonadaceae bacterium]|nr:serine hydrolase domain-containing protein [Pyrinomonadaceae bacterium]
MSVWRRYLSFVLTLVLLSGGLATPARARQAQGAGAPAAAQADLAARLAAVEKAVEEKRAELGVPGVALVIVKDDRVVYMKGLGVKDLEKKLPVTPDTLFAIGSSSKAFTAMTVALGADDGKLSLDDSPKKYLPYFKLQDADADARITVRDLMTHGSGLNRTDIAWITGALSREEVIRVAGMAKPTAKLREKFQYQNVMYSAAGEVAAKAQGMPWERVVVERIFKPLGMRASNLTVAETLKSPDYAVGYEVDATTKEANRRPMRDFPQVAAAGAINSNARDMARWLRLLTNGGTFEGKRLVSERSFNELVSPQMKIGGKVSYGLGWFIRDWHGHKVAEHGGNIDGFNALVGFMPDQKLGFAMLTNVSASPLGQTVMESVWSNLVGKPGGTASAGSGAAATAAATPSVSLEREAGSYLLKETGMTITVALKDGKLVASVPGQPEYPLESVGGRRYKLPLEGFFMTFRPVAANAAETEMYLEQPQGNFVLPKVKPPDATTKPASAATAEYTGPLKEVVGTYAKDDVSLEVAVRDGKVVLVVPGQPARELTERERDTLAVTGLPDTYSVLVRRDAAGKVTGIVSRQPNGEFEFGRQAPFVPPMSGEELMSKVIAAAGGEANLRRHKSMTATLDVDLVHQGVRADGVLAARAPNAMSLTWNLTALGKKIGTYHEFFDGAAGGVEATFLAFLPATGRKLEDARRESDFYDLVNWRAHFKTVEIKRMSKVAGEDAYVVVKTPEKGPAVTDYVSTKTFLVLRRDTVSEGPGGVSVPTTTVYSDYRDVDGVKVAFQTLSNNVGNGDIITRVKEVKFDVAVHDAEFRQKIKPQEPGR